MSKKRTQGKRLGFAAKQTFYNIIRCVIWIGRKTKRINIILTNIKKRIEDNTRTH